MLTELQAAKLDRRFELLDADGDGFITAADYDQTASAVCEAFDYPQGSPQHERVHMTFLTMWDKLSRKMDGKHTGRISRDQFLSSCADSIVERGGGYDRNIKPVVDAVFDIIDADGDGVLDVDELARWFSAYGVCEDDAQRAFTTLDRNGDGVLSRDEVHEAVEDYYTSDDPRAHGNRIYGPLQVSAPPAKPKSKSKSAAR